jgi:hypothetical protein
MTDPDEKNKIGDIDTPKDGPCQSCNAEPIPILVKVGPHGPEDDSNKNGQSKIKSPSRFSNRVE